MKKSKLFLLLLMSLVVGVSIFTIKAHAADTTVPVYRLYNPNTGEHFYTEDQTEEMSLYLNSGWGYEGIGWYAPASGTPVYRIYNPNARGGDHYYTTNKAEAQADVNLGWKWDNNGQPVFYSGGTIPTYVAYNPNASSGAHNYTTSNAEQNNLLNLGWKYGATAWQAAAAGAMTSQTVYLKTSMNLTQLASGDYSSIQGVWYSPFDTITISGNTITGSYQPSVITGPVDTIHYTVTGNEQSDPTYMVAPFDGQLLHFLRVSIGSADNNPDYIFFAPGSTTQRDQIRMGFPDGGRITYYRSIN